jgi:DNA invertase Pin-like site-specific DNA recombinase
MMSKVAIYARYSCDQQKETSIDDQVRRCKELAARYGLDSEDVQIFADSALSGTSKHTEKRHGYQDLIRAWDNGDLSVIIVDEFSRLTRDGVEQAKLVERLDNNRRVQLLSVDGIDSSKPNWQLHVGLIGLVGQQSTRDTRHRVERGMFGQLERGYMVAAPAYGYVLKRDLDGQSNHLGSHWLINPTTAAVVQEIYKQRSEGRSMHQIASWLNESGTPCSRAAKNEDGGYWRPARVKQILANRIYRGQFVWHGSVAHHKKSKKLGIPINEVIFERPNLRLVSDEIWDRCNANKVSRSGYGGGKHALAGLATCGHCGGTLVLSSQSRCRSLYCANCTVAKHTNNQIQCQSISVATAGVQFLLQQALQHFLTPRFVEEFRKILREKLAGDVSHQLTSQTEKLNKLNQKRERLSRLIKNSDEDDLVLIERYEEVRNEIRLVELSLAALKNGAARLDRQAIEAQLQIEPLQLLEKIFESDIPIERLRAVLFGVFPLIVLVGKEGRYTSIFKIQFAAGNALAMLSNSTQIDESTTEIQFKLRYVPDNRSGQDVCRWHVTKLETSTYQASQNRLSRTANDAQRYAFAPG